MTDQPTTQEAEKALETVQQAVEYNLHWLEAYYGIVEQDAEAKTNRRLSTEALAALRSLRTQHTEMQKRIEELGHALNELVASCGDLLGVSGDWPELDAAEAALRGRA